MNYITPSLIIIMMALCVNRLILRKVRKQDRETPDLEDRDMGHHQEKKTKKPQSTLY